MSAATWHVGDSGFTRGGMRYRILATDLAGKRGPIAAAITIGDDEMLHRMIADGTNDGGPQAYHLLPATQRAT